jgi:hypothetical protein
MLLKQDEDSILYRKRKKHPEKRLLLDFRSRKMLLLAGMLPEIVFPRRIYDAGILRECSCQPLLTIQSFFSAQCPACDCGALLRRPGHTAASIS